MRAIGAIVFAAILIIQAYCTFTYTVTYPFSPYRMFSKHWATGIVMENVRIRSGDSEYRPWDLLDVPFFQANTFMYRVFLDSEMPEGKERMCDLLRASVGNRETLVIEKVLVRYGGEGQRAAAPAVVERGQVHVCPDVGHSGLRYPVLDILGPESGQNPYNGA